VAIDNFRRVWCQTKTQCFGFERSRITHKKKPHQTSQNQSFMTDSYGSIRKIRGAAFYFRFACIVACDGAKGHRRDGRGARVSDGSSAIDGVTPLQ